METANAGHAAQPVLSYAGRDTHSPWRAAAVSLLVVILIIVPDLADIYLNANLQQFATKFSLNSLAMIYIATRWAVRSLLVIAGLWAYRRYTLPSLPWLVAWMLVSNGQMGLSVRRMTAGIINNLKLNSGQFTMGELLVSVSHLSGLLSVLETGLVGWFVLAELSFAYSSASVERLGPSPLVLLPRSHSRIFGIMLVASVLLRPLFWLGIWILFT